MATQRVCSIPDCGKKYAARGFCDPHFRRWKKSGDSFDRSPVVNVVRAATCTIAGCDKPHVGMGYCRNHYCSWHEHGDPLAAEKFRARKSPRLELLERASRSDTDECIFWPYAFDKYGYGQFSVKKKSYRAHRYLCERVYGAPDAPELQAAHSCGVRACVNPRHLRWATPAENCADKVIHGTALRGSRVKRARLKEADIHLIRERINAGEPVSKIAAAFGVTAGAIDGIRVGTTWAWLKDPVKPAPAPVGAEPA